MLEIKHIRAANLDPADLELLESVGFEPPLSARINKILRQDSAPTASKPLFKPLTVGVRRTRSRIVSY